jgi:hypothetical protein
MLALSNGERKKNKHKNKGMGMGKQGSSGTPIYSNRLVGFVAIVEKVETKHYI